jgi:hypothetical protein
MAQSTRLLTPLFTLASLLAAGSCSSANPSGQSGQSQPVNAEKETTAATGSSFATQVSFTPLQDFATKPMALRAARLEGTPEEVLAQVDYIARPGQDTALLMSCDGRSWKYEVSNGSSIELKDTHPPEIIRRGEIKSISGSQGTCSLQVEPGIYWTLQPNKERMSLSRLARDPQGALVKTHLPVEMSRSSTDRERSARPLGVASNLIAFAEQNAIAFYEVTDDSNADPVGANSKKISVSRFQWETGLYGTPLSAGRTADGHWILTRKNLVWFATRSDEQHQSEWLHVETVPVNFDETLKAAVSNNDSFLNVFIKDRASIKSISKAHSLAGLVFLKKQTNPREPNDSNDSNASSESSESLESTQSNDSIQP